MTYQIKTTLNTNFEETIPLVKEALKKEGFGIITEIDIKEKLKEKLDIDYPNYLILGACNPKFAHKAIELEKDIGLLLPCNIIIYTQDNQTIVAAINPKQTMSSVNNQKLKELAEQVTQELNNVIDSLTQSEGGK